MKYPALLLPLIIAVCSSCEDRKEVVVTETREITTKDTKPKLLASSDERFRDVKPSPVQGKPPENWLKQPATQFRLLNYRFGDSGLGEVWVSLSSGGVLDNVNRWLKQFSAEPIAADEMSKSVMVPIAGTRGVWVEAEGAYAGMRAEAQSNYGLAGVVAQLGDQILTLKMVGPKDEVEAAKADLKAFAESLTVKGQL